MELCGYIINVLTQERSRITLSPLKTSYFTEQCLNQMPNCHSGGDSMRIDYHVWDDTLPCEWKVLLSVSHTTGSFLTMSTSKFISNLWDPDSSHLDFCESERLLISCQNDLIDNTAL